MPSVYKLLEDVGRWNLRGAFTRPHGRGSRAHESSLCPERCQKTTLRPSVVLNRRDEDGKGAAPIAADPLRRFGNSGRMDGSLRRAAGKTW